MTHEFAAGSIGPAANRLSKYALLFGVAAAMTLMNILKPITADGAVYHLFATHIAASPFDPYGFPVTVLSGSEDANRVLAPAAFLYWWGLAIRLFGQSVIAWKLWLFPICLLLVSSLHALAERFAPGRERFFVVFVALSPAFLPSLNMMLDVPAIALGLFAVHTFIRACDTGSAGKTMVAAAVAAIAAQTKYTGFAAFGAILLYGALHRNGFRAIAAVFVSLAIFSAWELFLAVRYGDSHFLLALQSAGGSVTDKVRLVQPLFGYLGSVAPAGILLCMAALGQSLRKIAIVALATGAGYVLIAVVPYPDYLAMLDQLFGIEQAPRLSSIVFGILGAGVAVAAAAVMLALIRHPVSKDRYAWADTASLADIFLILWLLGEVAAYFILSPYPATRRILGIVAVGALLTLRLAARDDRNSSTGPLWAATAASAALGALLFVVDLSAYRGERELVAQIDQDRRAKAPDAKVWLFGNGAAWFYGERLGFERVWGRSGSMRSGDWIAVARGFEAHHENHRMHDSSSRLRTYEWHGPLPLRSQYQYGNVAVTHQEEPHAQVTLYRVE